MKKYLFLLFYLYFCTNIYSFFTDSNPVDNQRLIEESKVGYFHRLLPDSLNKADSEPITFEPVLSYKPILIEDGDVSKVIDPTILTFEKGETFFSNKDFKNALLNYEKAFELDNQNLKYICYAAQCHILLGNPQKAIKLCKKYLKTNYNYYLLHYFLASAYENIGDYDQAKDEIILAHILNRNHDHIIESMNQILAKLKKQQVSWNAYIKSDIIVNKDTVIIYQSPDSTKNFENYFYLICKALWLSDSTFVSERKVTIAGELHFALAMEIDSYHNKLSAFQIYNIEDKEPLEVKEFIKAVEAGFENQFILYEKILVDNPAFAYDFTEKSLKLLLQYFKQYKICKI